MDPARAKKPKKDLHGLVEFRDVLFSYTGADEQPALSHVSFTAHPGEATAIIGSTGSW